MNNYIAVMYESSSSIVIPSSGSDAGEGGLLETWLALELGIILSLTDLLGGE